MRMYKILESKRLALGLTQAEIGRLAGVSASAVSNLEAGKEVSTPVFNCIKMAIENELNALDKIDYIEKMLTMHTIQLSQMDNDNERIMCLGFISIYSNKLQLELLKQRKTEI